MNEGITVTVYCTRNGDRTVQSRVMISSEDGSAMGENIIICVLCVYTCEYNVDTLCSYYPLAGSDYDSVDFAGGNNIPRNVLNYRGGNVQDMILSFNVAIRSDSVEESPENFFINVMSLRTAIVLTPRVTVTICGGK